jgi:hypothetical protein
MNKTTKNTYYMSMQTDPYIPVTFLLIGWNALLRMEDVITYHNIIE